jgi:uncharacterized protein (DUF697 family)
MTETVVYLGTVITGCLYKFFPCSIAGNGLFENAVAKQAIGFSWHMHVSVLLCNLFNDQLDVPYKVIEHF